MWIKRQKSKTQDKETKYLRRVREVSKKDELWIAKIRSGDRRDVEIYLKKTSELAVTSSENEQFKTSQTNLGGKDAREQEEKIKKYKRWTDRRQEGMSIIRKV